MSKLRKLVSGDRVKITGPWCSDPDDAGGHHYIGKYATVVNVTEDEYMSINICVDGLDYDLLWERENLRALPRKAKPNER